MAAHMYQPYVDLIVLDESEKAGNIDKSELAWLTRLTHAKLLLRHNATSKCYVSLGCSLSDVCWAWPVRQVKACPDLYELCYKETSCQVLVGGGEM